ncbi:MAG TPA: N-acetylmuramic acid 6-phosphate etherase [Thermaerobacter sp.]
MAADEAVSRQGGDGTARGGANGSGGGDVRTGAAGAGREEAPPEILAGLVTEQPNPATAHLDELDTEEICRLINAEDHRVAPAVRRQIPAIAAAVDIIAAALRAGGRLFYVGAGTSGRLGVLDAAECPPTFGVDPELVQGIIAGGPAALVRSAEAAEDDRQAGARDLAARQLRAGDVVVALSASGRTPYCLGALEYARATGARTVAVTCNPGSPMGRLAEIAIEVVVGPEVLAGSTRMKAGTAQKMVLNMLSTAAMVRLGKCYGNRMVDLRPTNAKLRERARRMVAELGGCEAERAAALLEEAGGHVKTAIVMARTGLPAREAAALLERHGGFVRRALAAWEAGPR